MPATDDSPQRPDPDEAATVRDGPEQASETGPEQSREWWDDPALPWKHKPSRADLACWAAIAVVGVYGLAMLPLRPVLLGLNPTIAAMITGGRTSVVAAGAWAQVHGGPIALYWLVTTLSIMKFDWIYWWAGHLWGHDVVEVFAGKSRRAQRRAERAVRFTHRYETLAVTCTYVPVPLPMPVVYAAVGVFGMTLRRFLVVDFLAAGVFQALYLWAGWSIGQPAVDLVKVYADYMWYASIAVLVGMLVTYLWRGRRRSS